MAIPYQSDAKTVAKNFSKYLKSCALSKKANITRHGLGIKYLKPQEVTCDLSVLNDNIFGGYNVAMTQDCAINSSRCLTMSVPSYP